MNQKRTNRNIQTGMLPEQTVTINTSYAWEAQITGDLNALHIPNHDGPAEPIDSEPAISSTATAYFRDIETHLLHHIAEADAVVGCVAWLTSKAILDALAMKDPVSLVVQKEDFLRPDLGSRGKWAQQLRRRYDALRCSWDRLDFDLYLSTFGDPTLQPVRCVGNYNREKHPAFPRMHHKFVVFGKCVINAEYEEGWYGRYRFAPYAVWTGSFNFTENAIRSLENALFVTDANIVQAYYAEWERVVSLSEPLDWESDWVAPEWRIGT